MQVVVSIKATTIQNGERNSSSFQAVSSRPFVKAACAVKFEFWEQLSAVVYVCGIGWWGDLWVDVLLVVVFNYLSSDTPLDPIKRSASESTQWVLQRAPRGSGSRCSGRVQPKPGSSQWAAAGCTGGDGWCWACSQCSPFYKAWCGTRGAPSKTLPSVLSASHPRTLLFWSFGDLWATSHGSCLCGWWTKKVSSCYLKKRMWINHWIVVSIWVHIVLSWNQCFLLLFCWLCS